MLKSTEQIIEHALHDHIIRDSDLSHVFKGTAARRYALVNKMLKKGELLRLCRGFYMLARKYQKHTFSQYYFANRILPSSFVTAESALSFHGWIGERITQVTSITAFGRGRDFKTSLGVFIYRVTPVLAKHFYYGIHLIEMDGQAIYIASPLRALIDYVYLHKIKNANIDFLHQSLRIEIDELRTITMQEIKALKPIYRSHYVQQFLRNLEKGVPNG